MLSTREGWWEQGRKGDVREANGKSTPVSKQGRLKPFQKIGCLAQSWVKVHCSSLSEQPQANFPCSADCGYCMVTFLRRTGEDSCCAAWLRSHLSAWATETAELSTGDWSHGALSCSGDFMKIHGQGCDLIWSREWFVTKRAGDKQFSLPTSGPCPGWQQG